MEKAYNHKQFEDNLYKKWEDSGAMRADENTEKETFTIVLPPPNVTGQLHLGHAAMLAIEDIMIRYQSMAGKEVLWLPGTDHAAIATESKVIETLGIASREEMTRDEFWEACKSFAEEKHDTIVGQCKKMGAWLDWSREAYTLDEKRSHAVHVMFEKLWNDGLIVRGNRLVNWSLGAQSVLADDELEWDEITEPFYMIRCGEFVIGTVRPETKCVDSPVVVHPTADYVRAEFTGSNGTSEVFVMSKAVYNDKEKRSKAFNLLDPKGSWKVLETKAGKDMAGQKFEHETYAGKRNFYILADEVIDPEKGTGAMTISSAHSADDYDLAKRRDLQETFIQKIDFAGKMTDVAGPCAGMTVDEARKKSGQLMEEQGLLVGKDNGYNHRVPICYRTGTVVEPMISKQWFIAVNNEFYDETTGDKTTLKEITLNAVKNGHVDVIPERFKKTYYHWIENLQDWCISRQIWWGHQIPVWYSKEHPQGVYGENDPSGTKGYENETFTRDEDTLDTWFSSALWPFSTLGWPDENAKDMQKFFPNAVLETGWDIIFFWVARMIMFSRYATGRYPFHTTYLHGMVCDEKGKKMSKSKGNGIDPLDMIAEYGADAVRMSLVVGTTPGNNINVGPTKIGGYRNFVNKLWNASRFVQFQEGETKAEPHLNPSNTAEEWILSRLSTTAQEISASLEKYDISAAGDALYHFVWDEVCDWFIEASKADPHAGFSKGILLETLKLVHPFCPFITETCYGLLTGDDAPMVKMVYPKNEYTNKASVKNFALLQEIVNEIRSVRAEKGINPKDKVLVSVSAGVKKEILNSQAEVLKLLANISELTIETKTEKPERSAVIVLAGVELFVSVPYDPVAERARIEKEVAEADKTIMALQGRLSNKAYVDKAPQALVDATRQEMVHAEEKKARLLEELKGL